MNIPLSWLKDFVDVNLPLEELARVMTMAGLEVDEIHLMGLPGPEDDRHGFKFTGLSWPEDKFVVAEIREVNKHPDADKLVLCQLEDGTGEHTILTGAPNLYPYVGKGRLEQPIKVAYAREGAILYDGHKPGFELTKLKKTKIRGFETKSMVCSAKELGISEEHEGIIILEADAPTGVPLARYMGDAVFVIDILPNMARNACVKGVAREVAAQLNLPLKTPKRAVPPEGRPIDGLASVRIEDPEMNPRFILGYAEGIRIQPSPSWIQRRLSAAGMRPINSVVDATNYVMLELGQPLHSFDYDALVKRNHGQAPAIVTRHAYKGEKLMTLDRTERDLDESMMLVTDQAGALSIGGVMGGLESEIVPETTRVLLESAAWNFINIRKTSSKLRLNTEAGYRNSRGVHPAIAEEAARLCLAYIVEWSGGQVASGLIDSYALPVKDTVNHLSENDIVRLLGVEIPLATAAEYLSRLEFRCRLSDDATMLEVITPPHRLDIGEGIIGKADVLEEVARLFGYEKIPTTRMADELPPAYVNRMVAFEEKLRDELASVGLQEVVTYRFTSPEREAKLLGKPAEKYVTLANPISPDRSVMRTNLNVGMMEVVEKNIRLADSLEFFEIGPVFLPIEGEKRPHEEIHLSVAITGKRTKDSWDAHYKETLDFYDLKGIAEVMAKGLHISGLRFEPAECAYMHPGKCAAVFAGEEKLGILGELHPAIHKEYDLLSSPIILLDLNLEKMEPLSETIYKVHSISPFPAILEDIAVVVDETITAGEVEAVIRQAGGKLLKSVELFDIFRNEQIGAGKKSLAYSLKYQSDEKTLTDSDATAIRNKIIKRLDQVLGAKLRS